jgi:glycosyltransferase involved in cell wall biosynthesis
VSERPLSILFAGDYPADPTLGSPKVFYKLKAEFDALGHRCDMLLAPEIAGASNRQMRQLIAPWRAGRAIARRLESSSYDVVDAASAEGLAFGLMRKAGMYRRVALICRSNGLEQLNYRRMLDDAADGLVRKPWTRRLWYPASRLSQVAAAARVADRLLLLNQRDREYAERQGWQPPGRIDVVSHGVAPEFLADDPGDLSARGKGLLFCGSWDLVKGVPYLVRALERLHAAGRTVPLTVLGPGIAAADVIAQFDPAVRHLVRVVERSSEQVVRQAYREHDVLLWPSTFEGFGLVLIEAMSQRMAVVATPAGCASALIEDGVNGSRVPFRDHVALADAAGRLMDDAVARRRLGAAARDTVAELSWRRCAEHTLDCYRRARETAQ